METVSTPFVKIIFLIKALSILSLVLSVSALVFKLMTQILANFHGTERVSLAVTLNT